MRGIAGFIVLVLCAGIAAAQPTPEEKAEAKQAFQAAEAAERRKDWRTAIDEYQRAYDLIPHPDVLFNIAVDLERLEEYRDAATYYRRYLDDKGDDAQDRRRVEELIRKLRGRPGIVTITSEPAGAEVSVDGKREGRTPLELRLSGAHSIVVGDGDRRAERAVTVEFGESQTLDVSLGARTGTLVVRSNVDGADVMVDGAPAGKTPIELPLAQGTHRVTVTSPGWSTYDRPVDIHAEGTTQMTANLVRPLGYVPPVEAPAGPRGYLAVSGGADVRGEGGLYAITFGGHRGLFEGGLGYGFANQGAAFVIEAKVNATRTKLRPYVKGSVWLGTLSSVNGHVGVALQLTPGTKARTSVFIEIGVGAARGTDPETSEETSELYVPVTGGVQLSY